MLRPKKNKRIQTDSQNLIMTDESVPMQKEMQTSAHECKKIDEPTTLSSEALLSSSGFFDEDLLCDESSPNIAKAAGEKTPTDLANPLSEPDASAESSIDSLVSAKDAGGRLDAFVSAHFASQHVSREKCKQMILAGECLIDGEAVLSASRRLREGERITCSLPLQVTTIKPEKGDLHVYYEDEDILVLYKPAGLTIHPCPSSPEKTFLQRVLYKYPDIGHLGGARPGIVHRLDKDTSGLVVIARSQHAYRTLSDDFAERRVEKNYLAMVHGDPRETGECHELIGRDPQSKIRMAVTTNGREAHTFWTVLWRDPAKRCALLDVRIITGRTHQIRVHMAHCGFPLLGDSLYGRKKQLIPFDIPAYSVRFANAFLQENPTKRLAGDDIRKPSVEEGANVESTSPEGARAFGGDIDKSVDLETAGESRTDNTLHPLSKLSPHGQKTTVKGANVNSSLHVGSMCKVSRQMLHAWRLAFKHPVTGEALQFTSSLPQDMTVSLLSTVLAPKRYVLTGLPGSGKSTALHFFESVGVPVWSADACVKALCEPGQMGWLALRSHLGDRFFYDPACASQKEEAAPPSKDLAKPENAIFSDSMTPIEEWVLDRQALAIGMMQDTALKDQVEGLLHPLLSVACTGFLTSKELETFGMGIAEVPLWFERRGFNADAPPVEVIGIDAPDALRHARLLQTRSWDPERSQAFDAMHLPRSQKMKACDRVISNDADEATFADLLQKQYDEMVEATQGQCMGNFQRIQQLFDVYK